jgi:tRNA pseudouridine38-40 synthase
VQDRHRYKITVAYDGTNYGGWQVQPNAISVQSLVERSLATIFGEKISVVASGRTDAGVHAIASCAHFDVNRQINLPKTLCSLNSLLPKDIRIMTLEEVPLEFHARFSAVSKIYHYRLHLDPIPDPFKRSYAYHVPHRVDPALLKEAASHFIGTHDFTSFANEANRGSAAGDAVRTIFRIDIVAEEGGVRLEFEGDGFLYKMIRNIVGTLLDVCAGKIGKEDLPAILKAKSRKWAGRAAPPHGLSLVAVRYPD